MESETAFGVQSFDEECTTGSFFPEYDIPPGVRVETIRWGRMYLCHLKGSTLSTVGGMVHHADAVYIKAVRLGVDLAAFASFLRGVGYKKVTVEG